MPLFTVLINNYNYGRYVGQAIESVLAQSFADFELIVVDDGSTDNSKDVIRQYTDAHIRVILKSNEGQASCYNAGFEAAKGDVLVFLDSDDWFAPNKLERLAVFHNESKAQYGLMQHRVQPTFPPNAASPSIWSSCDAVKRFHQTHDVHGFPPSSGLCTLRETYARFHPVPLIFRYSADIYVRYASVLEGRLISIAEVLAFYRVHESGHLEFWKRNAKELFYRNEVIPSLNELFRCRGESFRFARGHFFGRKRIYRLYRILTSELAAKLDRSKVESKSAKRAREGIIQSQE